MSLIDCAYDPDHGVNQFFDGEGIVRSKDDYLLIDQGRFSGLVSNLRLAKKYGVKSSGNGLRPYNGGVMLAPRHLTFAKGKKTIHEVIQNLDRCLVALIAGGGDSNDLGEYSSPVQVGYVYEKGKLVGRAPQVTVKVSLNDYIGKDLIAVTSDSFNPGSTSGSIVSEMNVFLNQ